MVNAHYVIIDFRANFSLRFKIRQVTQVARFRLSQALPSCYARSLASDLGKSSWEAIEWESYHCIPEDVSCPSRRKI
jgi:hypothetical protein